MPTWIDGQEYFDKDEAMSYIPCGEGGIEDSVNVGRLTPVANPPLNPDAEYFLVSDCETTRLYYKYEA